MAGLPVNLNQAPASQGSPLTQNQILQEAFKQQQANLPPGSFQQLFATPQPLKPSFSVSVPKAARMQTALNRRIEALLGSADDFAQGEGLGLDTLLGQQLQDLITGQQSELTRRRIADVSGQLGNTLDLARTQLGAQSAGAGLGRSVSPALTEGALISQIAAERSRAEQDIIDRARQQASGLLGQILQQRAQRAQILAGLTFPGVDTGGGGGIKSVIGGGLKGAGTGAAAGFSIGGPLGAGIGAGAGGLLGGFGAS